MLKLSGGRNLSAETLGPKRCGEIGVEHFERHEPLMLGISGQIDGRHPPAPKLAIEGVRSPECRLELIPRI